MVYIFYDRSIVDVYYYHWYVVETEFEKKSRPSLLLHILGVYAINAFLFQSLKCHDSFDHH